MDLKIPEIETPVRVRRVVRMAVRERPVVARMEARIAVIDRPAALPTGDDLDDMKSL